MSDTGPDLYQQRTALVAQREVLAAQLTELQSLKLGADRRYVYAESDTGYLTLRQRREMINGLKDQIGAIDGQLEDVNRYIAGYETRSGVETRAATRKQQNILANLYKKLDDATGLYDRVLKWAEEGRPLGPDPTDADVERASVAVKEAEDQIKAQGYDPYKPGVRLAATEQPAATEPAPQVTVPASGAPAAVTGGPPTAATGGRPSGGTGASSAAPAASGRAARIQVVPDRLPSPAKAPTTAGTAATATAAAAAGSASGASAGTRAGAGAAVTDQQVTATLTRRGLADTPANRNQVRRELRVAANSDAWMATFTSEYPAYASWTTQEVIGYFGQDFVDVINKIALSGIEYTDEEKKAMLRNTRYFQQTTNNQQTFDKSRPAVQQQLVDQMANGIREEYGDVQFSETEIQGLARTAARNGLTGVGLRQEVYRTAFRTSEASKAPMLATQSLTGADADRIQRIGRAYGRRIRDEELKAILTGEPLNGAVLTEEGLRQRLQIEARAAFPQLADQIDAGLTLDDIGSRYKSYAADLLERDPNQIDMFSGPYLSAFGDKANGPMSLSDWTAKVKSDPVFGWQYTKQANDQATNIALSLARVFGKVG